MTAVKKCPLAPDGATILFSLGFNHDPLLVEHLERLNQMYANRARIAEVFGALPDAPVLSARPSALLPRISWRDFANQIARLRQAKISYNFLLNTAAALTAERCNRLDAYLNELKDCGVDRITAGTPELCTFIKERFPEFHVTISITFGIDNGSKLAEARNAGADALYLQAVNVNRDFARLRSLVRQAGCECRLYANVSCISSCPVVHQHYNLFGLQSAETTLLNNQFFDGCSLVKLMRPVEWIQMPWIRPEDIGAYVEEGILHFKLSDRLAPTSNLLLIAESYLSGHSPHDLFPLFERDGRKFMRFQPEDISGTATTPFCVHGDKIPSDFIEHFRRGECTSRNRSCSICRAVACESIQPLWDPQHSKMIREQQEGIPRALLRRIGSGMNPHEPAADPVSAHRPRYPAHLKTAG